MAFSYTPNLANTYFDGLRSIAEKTDVNKQKYCHAEVIFFGKTEKMEKSIKLEFLGNVIQSPNPHFSEIPHFIDRTTWESLCDGFLSRFLLSGSDR
ncbi:hypothetical protein SDC9_61843 [bioreactor metagenome]|uniref:Uncharacterized protein n=1 Tax=bioreactor metagenome TaxID=1076179 RepID=A0A644XGW4_9ZZZZ